MRYRNGNVYSQEQQKEGSEKSVTYFLLYSSKKVSLCFKFATPPLLCGSPKKLKERGVLY